MPRSLFLEGDIFVEKFRFKKVQGRALGFFVARDIINLNMSLL